MRIYIKSLILVIGIVAAIMGIFNQELSPAIVAAGAFIAYAMIEVRDLKTLNDDE